MAPFGHIGENMNSSRNRGRAVQMVATIALASSVIVLVAGLGAGAVGKTSTKSAGVVAHDLGNPTKALCKQKSYKIGSDTFSDSQPFAVDVAQGIAAAAKKVGCVQLLTTNDNESGPTAIGNLHTLLNEGIKGFIDFNVLAAFAPAQAKILKSAHVPAVSLVGVTMKGSPPVGANNFLSEKDAGIALATAAQKEFPGQVPYLLASEDDQAGQTIINRYLGIVAGVMSVYPNLPSANIIKVLGQGIETTAYSAAEESLSLVPAGSLVIAQGANDEDTGGLFEAIQADKSITNYLVESYGGDSYGLSQVCSNPTHYVGGWDLDPNLWGSTALAIVMDEMNHVKVPSQVLITGFQRTDSSKYCSS